MTANRLSVLTAAALVCLLAACGKKEDPKPADLACTDPAVLQNIRDNLQQAIKGQARTFADNDIRHFVDADKVIAAASELTVSLNNPQQDNSGTRSFCQAELAVAVPAAILQTAHTNAPLIYGDKALDKVIAERILGSGLAYNNGTFAQTLKYTPEKQENGSFGIQYAENGLDTAANALSGTLLPYGVKSLLLIDGKAVSIEDALKQAKNGGKIEIIEEPASAPAENAASTPAQNTPPAPDAPDILPPPRESEPPKPAVSEAELDSARSDQQASEREINAVWRGLNPTVQQSLQDEQREWIGRKNTACRRAAAKADDPARAEYLRLQCDAQQTRERTGYLRGFGEAE
ncbi:lysozyme inhibitor LprI family protein [Neisseria bacilliformis]|jgi:hypothetical protein|uniref:lysozyme inhibitor LprI family protein n=1 Tax=Neisseria bacilliformis TaxID=267212 RepID=UPI0028E622F5|nr:lysozyme inhibitor LprI family protein [Neisseria bacilliformis]